MKVVQSAGWFLVLRVMAGFVFAPGEARAFECDSNVVTAPKADETNVPTNTLLWGYSGGTTRLIGPSEDVVAMDERRLPIAISGGVPGTFPVLIPRAPLEPNADYRIELQSSERDDSTGFIFTTGPGPASAAPALPVLLSSEPSVGLGALSVRRGVSLGFDFDGILIGDMGELGAIASIDALLTQGDANLAAFERAFADGGYEGQAYADLIEPSAAALPMIQWVARGESLFAGYSDCGVWPRGASDSELARFGVLDLAGHFSGWASVPLELPSAAEAETVAAAEREARRVHNVQQGRPSACSLELPGDDREGSSERSRAGLLALAFGVVATGARRARRR